MIIIKNIRNVWRKIIITIENARASKIRESQLTPQTVHAVHGHIKVLYSTKVYSKKKMDQQIYAELKSQAEAKKPASQLLETHVVLTRVLTQPVTVTAPRGQKDKHSQMFFYSLPMRNNGLKAMPKLGRLLSKTVT